MLNFHRPDLVNLLILDKRKLMLSIKQDVEFLAKHKLMDYSLLLTIEDQQQRTLRRVSAVDLDYLLESIEEEQGSSSDDEEESIHKINLMVNTITDSRTSDMGSFVTYSPNLQRKRRSSMARGSFSNNYLSSSQRATALNLRNNSMSVSSLNAEDYNADEHGNINWHVQSACGRFIYHIAIIDFLQTYDMSKKIERAAKSIKLRFKRNYEGFGPNDISAADPESYRERFYLFMKKEVFKFIA